MKRIGWVLGWAVPEAWFAPLARAVLPDSQHTFFPAAPDTLPRISAAGRFDRLVGYSLGAQLLLASGTRAEQVALLAPIFAFPREENSGGRMARAQVRLLARWLRRDPRAALTDFYARAELDVPVAFSVDFSPEVLQWGLAQLETVVLPPALPPGWLAWCGADDTLLDTARMHALVPELVAVPGATHHPRALLQAYAETVEATA
jgi:hypothetical protein